MSHVILLDNWIVIFSGALVELTLALLCLSQYCSKVKDVVLAHLHERLYISASFMRFFPLLPCCVLGNQSCKIRFPLAVP